MIAMEIILHFVYSKSTGIYTGFCMCHKLKDEDEDTYVIHPLPLVGPGWGGDQINMSYMEMTHRMHGNGIFTFTLKSTLDPMGNEMVTILTQKRDESSF